MNDDRVDKNVGLSFWLGFADVECLHWVAQQAIAKIGDLVFLE